MIASWFDTITRAQVQFTLYAVLIISIAFYSWWLGRRSR